jgi:hypothetical protein
VLLLVLALAAGAGGGWFLRGRVAPGQDAGTEAAAPSGSTTAKPAPAGREFSEQAVTPPPSAAAPPGPAATAPANRATPAPAVPPSAATPKPPVTGTLIVRSTPNGAGVTVNGRWRGRTPLTLEDLPLQKYDLRVVRQGFEPLVQAVVLTSDTPERALSLRLERLPPRAAARPAPAPAQRQDSIITSNYTGSIYVDSRPRGARVSIDGKAIGVTPVRVPEVRIGSHVVRLELPDHRIWSSSATVAAGQESRVTGSLERIQ